MIALVLSGIDDGEDARREQTTPLPASGPAGDFDSQFCFVSAALLEAQSHDRLGRRATAREQYAEARRIAARRS